MDEKDEKSKKKKDQKQLRAIDAENKKLSKSLKPTSRPKSKTQDSKSKEKLSVASNLDAASVINSRMDKKRSPADRKLKQGSELRRKLLQSKTKRTPTEKEKADSRSQREEKRLRLDKHLKEKAQSRENLDSQRQGLQAEIRALNKIENIRESSGAEYTVKFSGFQSAIAAGPMGAASTGLRKLDPSILVNMKRAESGVRVQSKFAPQIMAKLAQLGKIVRDLKIGGQKTIKERPLPIPPKDSNAEVRRIVNSKLRMKILDMKDRLKDPNRDARRFEETNMPFRGVDGPGGM